MICLCSIALSSWWYCLVYDLSVLHCLVLWSIFNLCSIVSSSWWYWLVYDLSVLHCLVFLVILVGLFLSVLLCLVFLYDLSVLHCLVFLVILVCLWFVCAPLPRPLGDIVWSMICLCSVALSSWWHWLVYDLSVLHCLVFLVTLVGLWFVCVPLPRPRGDIGRSMICLCSIASSSWWHWLVYDLSVLHCLVILVTLVGLWFVCAPLPRTLCDIGWSMICLCSIASSSWWHWLVYLFVCARLPRPPGDNGWSMICLCSIASSSWWHWLVYDLSVLHCLVLLVTLVGLWFVCAPLPRHLGDIGWSMICLCSIALSSWWYWLVYDLSVLHCLVLLVTLIGLFICLCSIASSSWWQWLVYDLSVLHCLVILVILVGHDLSVLHCLVILVTMVGLWFVCAPLPRHLGDIGWSMICLCFIASSSWWHWLVYDLSVLYCLVLLVILFGLWFVYAPLPRPLGDISWSMICLCFIASSFWWHWLVYDLSVLHCLVLLVRLVGLWFVCAPLPCPLGNIVWSMICLCLIASSSWWHWLVYVLSVLHCLVLLVSLVGLWFVCALLPCPLGDIVWSMICLCFIASSSGLYLICAPLSRLLGDIGWSMICLCSIASSSWWYWLVFFCLCSFASSSCMICLCSIASSSWWYWFVYDLSVLHCLVLLVTLFGLWFVCAPLPRPLGDIGWSMICLCSIAWSSWWYWFVYDLSVLHCLVLLMTLFGLRFVCAPLPRPLDDIVWSMICLFHWIVILVTLVGPWFVCAPLPRPLGDIGWSMICLCSIASSSWWHWLVYNLSVLHCLVLLVTLFGLWFVCAPLPRHLGDIGWSMICLCSIALSSWWYWLVYDLSVLHCLVLLVTLIGLFICLCSIASSSWWQWLVYDLSVLHCLVILVILVGHDLSVLHCLVILVTMVGLWFVCAPLPRHLGDIGWSMICLCFIASSSWWHWLVYDLSVLYCLVLLVILFGLWFVYAPLPRPLGDISWSMICLCFIASSFWWHWLVYDLSVLHCLVLLVRLVGLWFVCAPLPCPLGNIVWSMICLCLIASSSWWHWLVYVLSVLHCLVLLVSLVGLWFVCALLPCPLGDIVWSMICLCFIASSSGLYLICAPLSRLLGDIGWSMICLCSIASSSWWYWLVFFCLCSFASSSCMICLCSIASSSWWYWFVYDLSVLHCLVLLVTLFGLWFVCAPLPRPLGDIGWSMICLCSIAWSSWWYWFVYDLSVLHCLVLLMTLFGLRFVCAPLPRPLDDIVWSMICLFHWIVILVTLVGPWFVCAPLPRPLGDIGWSMICLCSIASSSWWQWLVYDLSVLHCLVILVTLVGLWFVCAPLPCPLGDIGWSMICLCSIASSSWWHWLVYDLSVLNCLVLLVILVGLWFVCAPLPRPLGDIDWSIYLSVLDCLVLLVTMVGLWFVCAPLPRHLGDIGWSWFVCAPLPRHLGDNGWSMICLCSIASSSWWHWLVYDLSVLHCLVLLVTLVGLWFVCALLPCPLGDIVWSMICLCSIASSSWWH